MQFLEVEEILPVLSSSGGRTDAIDSPESTVRDYYSWGFSLSIPRSFDVYAKDEKALCFHGELLYEAKVLESKPSSSEDKKSAFMYRVHYKGWKNT